MSEFIQPLQQCASIAFYGSLTYAVVKTVNYFTSDDKKSKAIDDAAEVQWNTGRNILIGHRTASRSVLKAMVDENESHIDEVTYNRVTERFKEIEKEFGAESDIHVHLRTPGGVMFYGMLIAHRIFLWRGKVVAHIHGYACSAGTLIAMACQEIVMDTDSVLGPVDPQVPKKSEYLSITGYLEAVGIDPVNLGDDDLQRAAPLFPIHPVAVAAAKRKRDDLIDAAEAGAVAKKRKSRATMVVPPVHEEKEKTQDLLTLVAINMSVLNAVSTLKSYKHFMRRILGKNYAADRVDAIISFFWINRPHDMPIYLQDCVDIGLHIVARPVADAANAANQL